MELTEKELRQRGIETHYKKIYKWYEKYLIDVKLNYNYYYAKTKLETAINQNSTASGSNSSGMVRTRHPNVIINSKQISLWHSDEEGNLVVSEKAEKDEG